jgi:hypothetical protein
MLKRKILAAPFTYRYIAICHNTIEMRLSSTKLSPPTCIATAQPYFASPNTYRTLASPDPYLGTLYSYLATPYPYLAPVPYLY